MPFESQNAQISAILGGRVRARTRTSLPARIVGSMDVPSTGSQSEPRALDRSNEATALAGTPSADRPGVDGPGAGGPASSLGRGVMVAGLPVLLTVDDEALAVAVADLFQPMADDPGPYAVEFVFGAEAPVRPSRAPDEVYESIRLWRDGDDLFIDSGGLLLGAVTRARAQIGGAHGDGPRGLVALRRIIHHAVAHVLSLNGHLVVHGAAIARDGRAVLLLGPSGAGKSTAGYLASLDGWTLLSDDLAVVRHRDGGLDAVGVHRAVAVPPEVVATDAAQIALDPRSRRRPAVVLDARPARIAAVAIVGHAQETGTIERISGVEVARFFLGATPAAGHGDVAAEALRAAGVLGALPCFRLLLPADVNDRRTSIGSLLMQIAEIAGWPQK